MVKARVAARDNPTATRMSVEELAAGAIMSGAQAAFATTHLV